eukprot:5238469-Karenia_brevis.AAC.1
MGHMGRNCPSKGQGKGGPPVGKGASIPPNPLWGKGSWGASPRSTSDPREGSPWSKRGSIARSKGQRRWRVV